MTKPLIGTRAHAEQAVSLRGEASLPDEWQSLGGGSMRYVYLHKPTGVVYKIESWGMRGYGNSSEVLQARRLRQEKWDHVRIPKVSSFKVGRQSVVAMEYVDGVMGSESDPSFNKPAREEMYHKGRLEDMHGHNFLFENSTGKLVPVDIASPRVKHGRQDSRVLTCGNGSAW